ncbi:MAG: hypothetical protein HWE13_09220 [Gammaproteobacteria bacterium]|nr:hypothetical protein [Gammaproteobacteria bacterium]NVK88295.1 hypothetical protein [Gammaproteobacteria bacterium]
MKTIDSLKKEHQYALFYRSSRVYRNQNEWFFESCDGDSFGPFNNKEDTMRAVRIYNDVKRGGVNVAFRTIQKVI